MKQHKTRNGAENSAFESDFSGRASDRQAQRKTQQFCRQVQRALNLVLADDGMVFVEEVSPAPDCGRLLVHVLLAPEIDVTTAMTDLRRRTPSLRAEVARAITRKRAPELAFAPAMCDGGEAHE